MLNEYYDLEKSILELKKNNIQESEKIKNNLETDLFEINIKSIKVNPLNNYIKNVKKSLIKNGFLDYLNKPNYSLLNEIREDIFNQELIHFITLDFFEFTSYFLKNENIIFYHILKKIKENEYLIFLFNYDFLENELQINYQNIIDLYYNTNQKKISEEEMKFQIENIKIKVQQEKDFIKEIYDEYIIFESRKKEYSNQIENLINEINNFNILTNKIKLQDILKNEDDFFLNGIKNSKGQLEGVISEFVYENEIQKFLDYKVNLIQKINVKKNEILEMNNKILENNFEKKYLEIKEYNYSIRELSNSHISNSKNDIHNNKMYKIEDKFYNKNLIEIIKIKNNIKKIKSDIEILKEKQKEILEKINNYQEDTQRNSIIKNRYQKIIDKYQSEIDNLKLKIKNLKKNIEDKNNLGNANKFINKNIIEKKDNMQELIEEIKKEKDKKFSNLEEEKRITNDFNIEIKKEIKIVESEIIPLENELRNLKVKNSNKFLIYENYKKKIDSYKQSQKIFTEIKILRDFFLKNEIDYKNKIKNFYSYQQNLLDSIKNMEKSENYWIKIEYGISLIKILDNLIKNQNIYNTIEVEKKIDFFYFNLLEYIDLYQHNYSENKLLNYENNFCKYNEILYNKLNNIYELENLEGVSIDLKKMIYILQ